MGNICSTTPAVSSQGRENSFVDDRETTIIKLPVKTWSIVVCRNTFKESVHYNKWLAVLEKNGKWWLPGGGVDFGEKFEDGAIRESIEEANMKIVIKGVLNVEYFKKSESYHTADMIRLIYYAEPVSL